MKYFEEMSEAHEAIKKVYKSAVKLVLKLSSKGMGVFLEALALGTLDTRVANILQDARQSSKLHEEVKTTNNISLFGKHKEMQKNRMLLDWMHSIFKQKVKYWPVGNIATAVMVFLQYAMGEKAKDVTLTTISELFPTGEQKARKVAAGKLYDTKGKRVEDLFLKTQRAYEGDPIDWKQKAVVPKTRYFPHTAGEPKGGEEHDMSEALDMSEKKFITRVIGMAIKEELKDEDIAVKMRRFTRSQSQRMPAETVTSSSQPPELLETIDLCSSDEGEKMEEGDIAMISTVVQLRKETTTEVPLADDDDEESRSSSEDGSNDDDDDDDDGEDLFDIEELQQIYEEHLADQPKEVKAMEEGWEEMDTSKATEEPIKLVKPKAVPTKQKATPMVKVKKSECPRVEKSTIPTFHIPEPVMTRARGKEKMLGERLLAEFERVEAEEKVKKKAKEETKKGSEEKTTEEAEGEAKKGTQMKGKHHRRTQSKAEQTPPRKSEDLERMDTEELEGPSSRQVTPAEKSIFSDRYTVEMSLEEVQLWNKLIEPTEWDLNNLDDVYVSLDCYCELRRQRKGLDEGDLPEAQFRTMVASRLGHFQAVKALLDQQRKQELQHRQHKGTPK